MVKWVLSVLTLVLLVGCAQKTVVPLSPQTGFDDAPGLERHDFDQLTPALVDDMLLYAWYGDFSAQHNRLPAIYLADISNDTPENLDVDAAKKSMQQALLTSAKVMLVDNQAAADYSVQAKIEREQTQTDTERRSQYTLQWTLTAAQSRQVVWSAENKVKKIQRIRRF